MALKDWEKGYATETHIVYYRYNPKAIFTTSFGNTYSMDAKWEEKEIVIQKLKSGNWGIAIFKNGKKQLQRKDFKTKSQALAKAKSYMRSH